MSKRAIQSVTEYRGHKIREFRSLNTRMETETEFLIYDATPKLVGQAPTLSKAFDWIDSRL